MTVPSQQGLFCVDACPLQACVGFLGSLLSSHDPKKKNMYVRLIGYSKLPIEVGVVVFMWPYDGLAPAGPQLACPCGPYLY